MCCCHYVRTNGLPEDLRRSASGVLGRDASTDLVVLGCNDDFPQPFSVWLGPVHDFNDEPMKAGYSPIVTVALDEQMPRACFVPSRNFLVWGAI